MALTAWMLIIGLLLIAMAMSGSVLRRLPLSTSMLYLGVGLAIGPGGLGLLNADPLTHSHFLERAAEIAVIISLFSCGLKLKLPLGDPRWRLSLRLAVVSMVLTVLLIAIAAVYGLHLSWGAAILLGAILAPTDPVLASDVQVREPGDRDRLRFSLTSEAGLNDGTAFPFVMLGLGLLGLHEIGTAGWRWWAIDVTWAVAAGLAVGSALGWLTGRLILYLRIRHREAIGLDEFLTLGLIALSYGVALLVHAYGFLAVFAAGLALQRTASTPLSPAFRPSRSAMSRPVDEPAAADPASDPERAQDALAHEVLSFTEQLERIGEVALVLAVGAMLWYVAPAPAMLWLIPTLFVLVRPVSVWLGLAGSEVPAGQRALIAWFGIRGIGSLYYVFYAINHGLPQALGEPLLAITLATIAASVVVHGISVTPLMRRYARTHREATDAG